MGKILLGRKIKSLREKHGITRSELSEHLGIRYSTIANYENNERQPDFETLKQLAQYFHVSIDFLLDNTNADGMALIKLPEFLILREALNCLSKSDLLMMKRFLQRFKYGETNLATSRNGRKTTPKN